MRSVLINCLGVGKRGMPHENWRECPRKEALRTLNSTIASRALTVVAAPAGYGKTVMAQKLTGPKLADGTPRRRFFHSVPGDSSSVREWWDALFSSLVHQGMESAREIRRIGFPHTPSMTRQVVELLENAAPFLLILDDFHGFADPAVDAFLEALVRAEPSEHRFALFSRTLPRMPLGELERAGLAAVHTQELLEFSLADAARFFFLNGVADREAAAQAWRYSEGWITALWLCLFNRKTGEKAPPPGDIESLLDAAVFAGYPAEEQDFLLRLSVLESFTAKEAETLSQRKDADDILRDMAGGNALIRRDDSVRKYVFHSIFRDFLAKKLASRGDLDIPDLYRRAAECHIRRRDSLPAFRLLVRAGRDEDLLRILDVIASDREQSIYNMGRDDILPIIERIPWRIRVRQPFGYFHCVWLCLDNGHDQTRVALFDEMEARFAAAKEIPPHAARRLAGEMEQMRGWVYLDDEPHLLAPRYRRARELLEGPSIIREEQRCWNYGTPHMLATYLQVGMRYPELRAAVETGHQSVRALTGYVAEGTSLIADAEYRLERGECAAALRLVDELDQILDFPRNMTSLIMARFLRARILSLRSGAENADNAVLPLSRLLRDIRATGSSEHARCAELALGFVLAHLGLADAAPRWLRNGDVPGQPVAVKIEFMVVVRGKLFLARDDMDGFNALLSDGPDAFAATELTFNRIHAAVFGAIPAWRRGDEAEAARRLREAVECSRPDGFILPVAEYGGYVLPVLLRLAGESPGDAHLRSIIDMAERIAALQRHRERGAAHAFTDRERDIMRLVAKGKSTSAIADKLGCTQPSVKNALTRLYAKMGVKNRTEAARLFQNVSRREKEKEETPSAAAPEKRDERMDAFRALLHAGRDEDLARALELFGPSGTGAGSGETMARHFRELRDAVQTFPWEVRLKNPLAYLAFLWRQFRTFDRGTSGMDLDEAEYRLAQAGRCGGGLAGEIALLRSLLRAHDATAFWNGCAAAAKQIGRPSRLHSREASWTFGNPHSSFIAVREQGDFDRLAEPAAAASSALAALSGGECVSLDAAFRMERHLERGELPEARALLSRLENRGERDIQTRIVSAFACARLLLADGLPTMAVAGLEGIAPRVRALRSFDHAESLDLALGYVHAHLGQVDAVPEWIRSGKTATLPHGSAARCPFACVVYGKSLLAAGDFARLRAAARAMPARFGAFDSLIGRIHAKALEAVAEKNLLREDDALSRLAEAVELSRPDGLVFPIAEYREHVLSLLRRLQRECPGGHIERVTAFALRKYRSASIANEGNGGARRRRILTPREREILDLAARGKSNHEIACELGVSGSRVINALTRIYGKVGVSNRVEASLWFAKEYGRSAGV